MISSVLQSHANQTSAGRLVRVRHTCAHVLAMAVQTLIRTSEKNAGSNSKKADLD
jgi:threonyl-tRNA synthetase